MREMNVPRMWNEWAWPTFSRRSSVVQSLAPTIPPLVLHSIDIPHLRATTTDPAALAAIATMEAQARQNIERSEGV